MRAVGIFDTVDGGSVLLDVDLPGATRITNADGARSWTNMFEAAATFVAGHDPGHTVDWHTASTPVLSIVVEGAWEIEASNGDKRMLELGSILLVMDCAGKGHRSRMMDGPGAVMGIRLTERGCAALKAACSSQTPTTVRWPC